MAEISGLGGLTVPPGQSPGVRGVGAVAPDGQGRGDSGSGAAAARSRGGDAGPPPVIRFEGRDLDPMAPRGTYLDITV